MHIATYRPGPDQLHGFQNVDTVSPAFLTNADHWVRMSLADMIFAGVFERYPQLRVGTVEQELSWPRIVRRAFSDPVVPHESTGVHGRGTEEVKTNDVSGRVKVGEVER